MVFSIIKGYHLEEYMGHSTVSFSVNKKLSTSEIQKEFSNKQSEDKAQYGYEQSPDSFYGAYSPSTRYLGSIYSPLKAREIIDKVRDYESICLYTVSHDVFKEIHKKTFKKIDKIKMDIKELNETLIKASDKATEDLKNKKGKDVFITTPCCKSKINASAMHKHGYNRLHSCPVCGMSEGETFANFWRLKNLGSAYAKLKTKIDAKILGLQNKIQEMEKALPQTVDESKLTKAQKNGIKTVFAADVHH
jgi:hypothetical protein